MSCNNVALKPFDPKFCKVALAATIPATTGRTTAAGSAEYVPYSVPTPTAFLDTPEFST
jgi:hypothetical protein